MAYIGRGTDKISNIEKLDVITFDGSQSYTLQKNSVNFVPNSANSLQVSIDGVVQAGNFTVSGSTIDFGVAIPATSTNDFIFHYGTGLITTPADGTVGLAQLSATGTKDATTFLRGDNTFASAGGTNTPNFSAVPSGSQSITQSTWTAINFGTELYDTDSGYDGTNKFTVPTGKGGKYFINANISIDGMNDQVIIVGAIYKNGAVDVGGENESLKTRYIMAKSAATATFNVCGIVEASAGDYFQVYINQNDSTSRSINTSRTGFRAFKIIE